MNFWLFMINSQGERMTDVQGQNANKSGKYLERQVEEHLNGIGYASTNFSSMGKLFGKKIISQSAPGFLLKNVPYINMYGGQARGEFVLKPTNKPPVRIECRFQNVSGSVDEKLPFLIGNCLAFEEKDVVLVIEGDGMRKSALAYVKNAARAIAHKHIRVFTLTQFKSWANRNLRVIDNHQDNIESTMKKISNTL